MRILEKILFFLLLFLLPTQLGYHFWPSWSYISGIRIDYLSPVINFTDILLFLLFIRVIIFHRHLLKINFKKNIKWTVAALFVFLLIFAGIVSSRVPAVGIYQLGKWIGFGFWFFYLSRLVRNSFQLNEIVLILSLGLIFESALSIAQFLHQGSIGNFFWWFGERTFTGQTVGIAQAVIDGQLILRPYGTLPHPNVLAGYLIIVLTLIIGIPPYKKIGKAVRWFAIILGTLAIFFTFSRTAWTIGFFIILFYLIKQRQWPPFLLIIFITIISFGVVQSRFQSLFNTDRQSWQNRQELNSAATEMIKNNPVLGVGLGNFLPKLPFFHKDRGAVRIFQPAHNFYLMMIAETGILVFVSYLGLLFFTYRRLLKAIFDNQAVGYYPLALLVALSAILAISFADHYFYTLGQGQFLLSTVLGLSWSSLGFPEFAHRTGSL